MIKIEVPGAGAYTSKIAIVGEAPDKHDVNSGKNFFGPAGEILFEIISSYGLKRSDIYLTTVYKRQLPKDSISLIDTIMDKDEQRECHDYLWKELEAIKPNVILGIGNTALNVLTGNDGITKWRGSILRSSYGGFKVICTINPSNLLGGAYDSDKEIYSWKQIVFLKFDINRAIKESAFPDINIPKRHITIAKNSQTMWQWLERFKDAEAAANDIETYKSIPHCAGVAPSPYEAMVFPLFNIPGPGNSSINIPRYERIEMWRMYAQFLSGNIRKVGQNYDFDINRQEQFGFKVNNFYSDIMLKMSVLYPELPKKLAVSTSIFTKQPYYKDEGREYHPKKDNPDRLMNYCGLDVTSTKEIDEMLELEFDKVRRN